MVARCSPNGRLKDDSDNQRFTKSRISITGTFLSSFSDNSQASPACLQFDLSLLDPSKGRRLLACLHYNRKSIERAIYIPGTRYTTIAFKPIYHAVLHSSRQQPLLKGLGCHSQGLQRAVSRTLSFFSCAYFLFVSIFRRGRCLYCNCCHS